MSSQAPPANFDFIARPYRWMEYLTFGRALERCRTHFIPALPDRREALVLGDGDGRFLARLLAANPTLVVDAVDSSAAMLRLLTRRSNAATSRLRVYNADIRDFCPTQTYDLIVTHFFLDCLAQSEVDALALRLASHAAPNAVWLVSDFCIPAGPIRWPAQTLILLLYLAFRSLTGLRTMRLPYHAGSLAAAGFTLAARHRSLAGLLTTEIWEYTRHHAPTSATPKDTSPTGSCSGPGTSHPIAQ